MSEFWQIFFWIIEIFLFLAYLMVLFNIISDLFRDHETSGIAKAVWVVLLLFIPLLTALAYLIIRGKGMAERAMAQQAQAKESAEAYIRNVVGTGPASEIAAAKNLLDSGAISDVEFESLKSKILN